MTANGNVAIQRDGGTGSGVSGDASVAGRVPGTDGGVPMVAGFAGLFLGVARMIALIDWFLRFSDATFRVWAAGAVAFGAFIVYAAL